MVAPGSGGGRQAEPLEQQGDRDDDPPTKPPAGDLTSSCGFVCGAPAQSKDSSRFLDRDGEPAFERIKGGVGERMLGHVGTSQRS
jgi:hypothetical protein